MAWKRSEKAVGDSERVSTETGDASDRSGASSGDGDSGGGSGSSGGSWGDLFGDSLGTGSDGGDTGTDGSVDDGYVYRDGQPVYNLDGSQRRKRGRRSGSSGGTSAAKQPRKEKVRVDSLSRFLAFAHMAVAGVTQTPELELSDNEASMLARPMSEIMSEYGVKIDPKVMLWMELTGAASYVYGPRVAVIRMRLRAEKEARDAKAKASPKVPAHVVGPIRPNTGFDPSPGLTVVNGAEPTTNIDATFGIDGLQRGKFAGPTN